VDGDDYVDEENNFFAVPVDANLMPGPGRVIKLRYDHDFRVGALKGILNPVTIMSTSKQLLEEPEGPNIAGLNYAPHDTTLASEADLALSIFAPVSFSPAS
jgi:hypothetical protein